MIGDKRWKQIQERTGPHNKNLVSEVAERLMETSGAGSIALTRIAMNTDVKSWTPAITPDRWEKKRPCRHTPEENTKREGP